MEISRVANGETHTYELTEEELYQAFLEQEHQFDRETVLDPVIDLEDEEIFADHGIHKEEFFALADQIAYEMRRLIDYNAMGWQEARDAAIASAVTQYLGAGKNLYKIVHKEELVGWYYVEANSEEEALERFSIMCNGGEIDFSDMEIVDSSDAAIEIEPVLLEEQCE